MTPDELTSDGSPAEWWFNTKTGEVEFGRLSASPQRLGPFGSKEEASRALEFIARRAAQIREEDDRD